ncbi:hypothetical protein TNCV_3420721 [Trichonephila clavipes]|nr:hypothetical protein TNCV_3420721 [Trichonephila clavipes]
MKLPISSCSCDMRAHFAIKSALEIFLLKSFLESSGIIIFTDSRSAQQVIQKGKCQISHKIITKKEILYATIWIPAHTYILGNGEADELAKESRAYPPIL